MVPIGRSAFVGHDGWTPAHCQSRTWGSEMLIRGGGRWTSEPMAGDAWISITSASTSPLPVPADAVSPICPAAGSAYCRTGIRARAAWRITWPLSPRPVPCSASHRWPESAGTRRVSPSLEERNPDMHQEIDALRANRSGLFEPQLPGVRLELVEQRRFRIDQLEKLRVDAAEAAAAGDGIR